MTRVYPHAAGRPDDQLLGVGIARAAVNLIGTGTVFGPGDP